MSNNGSNNAFSFGDALFLHIERDGQPLNIAGISIFEGELRRAEVMKFIASKLPLVPRYRQRVLFPPLDIGLPTWELDPEFDIRHHVREVKLKHGTEQELKALAGKIVSTRLDRRRPLWDFTVARLQGGRTGIVARIHHCLADGIAGVGLMNVIMDSSASPRPVPKQKPQPQAPEPEPPKDAAVVFLSGLAKSYLSLVSGALTLHSGLLSMAEDAVTRPTHISAETLALMSELAAPAERLPFNMVCRGPQKFACAELPLPEIKIIKNRHQTTVNDVVLTVITSTFARYAAARGVELKGRSIRIVIPVNVRGDDSPTELGNRISFVPVAVPLDIGDSYQLLRTVHERVEILKRAHAAEMVGLLGSVMSALPNAFWAMVGPVASQLPLSLCNTICTNVHGPETPLYLMGHKMLSWYPWVPIGGLMGINVAILTYNGMAFFGFTGDVHAAPDLERLEDFVRASFAELKAAAAATGEVKPVRPGRVRPNAAIPVTAATAIAPRKKTSAQHKKSPPKPRAVKPVRTAKEAQVASAREKEVAVGA